MNDSEEKVYLRPMGIVTGAESRTVIDAGFGLPLAGRARAFTLLELIRRSSGATSRRMIRVADRAVMERLVGERQLSRLSEPRDPIVGMDGETTNLMGVINVTPDSFSDGGRFNSPDEAIAAGQALQAAGAHLIDVGGESTRPGSDPISEDEELRRVLPVLTGLAAEGVGPLSIDSRKARVLRKSHEAGAVLLNDVSALTYDPESVGVAVQTGAPVVLMHAKGKPKTMQLDPYYDDVLLDVYDWLEERVAACEAAGVPRCRLILDPGIGFGKHLEHNLALLHGLSLFHGLGCLLLVGVSRKSFIGVLDRDAGANGRLAGSLAAMLAALEQGVQIFRVHDVEAARQALRIFEVIAKNQL
jgi:dihydropteroate synthase